MHKNKAISQRVILILLVLNLILSAGIVTALICLGVGQKGTAGEEAVGSAYKTAQKYTLYIGLNDKDTYRQIISTSQAREVVDTICSKYTDGYTRFDATGGWTDPAGTLTQEETLVYMFYDIDEENLRQIMDEALDALNQNSILVERGQSVYTYYSGTHREDENPALQN